LAAWTEIPDEDWQVVEESDDRDDEGVRQRCGGLYPVAVDEVDVEGME